MNNVIDAGTAKLAGLQIDLLQKVRQGHVTLKQIEWFLSLSAQQRDMVSGADLKLLVPVFPIHLDRFKTTEEVLSATAHTHVSSAITSQNFPLKPVSGTTRNIVFIEKNFFDHDPTSEEVLAEATRHGWKRPTPTDALIWDAEHPNEQGIFIFLHEPVILDDESLVIDCTRDGGGWDVSLRLSWFDGPWHRNCRFGFVSE